MIGALGRLDQCSERHGVGYCVGSDVTMTADRTLFFFEGEGDR